MGKQRIMGGATVAGVLCVLTLIAIAVVRHPVSIQGPGSALLRVDVALLLLYGAAGIWSWFQRRAEVAVALAVGAQMGMLLGFVHIANHLIEFLVPERNFILVISPVLLMLALLGAAGSIAWQHTRSVALSVVAGLSSAIVATLIALSGAICFNLAFEARAELHLKEAFAASGMHDDGAFLVRNILEAASELLMRMPVFALVLSFIGCMANMWIARQTRRVVVVAALFAPVVFVTGALALWHADSLERAARPPFVLCGVFLAGVSLCCGHPIWSALRRD